MPNLFKNDRIEIERELYHRGLNVALYYAEHDIYYKKFLRLLENKLYLQIKYFVDNKDILLELFNLAKKSFIERVAEYVADVSIGDMVDIGAFLIWAGQKGGQKAYDNIGVNGIFGMTSPELLEFFDNHENLLIESLDETTTKWVANVIQRGKLDKKTPYEIALDLARDGVDISQQRAEKIAITELANAMTFVENEVSANYGLEWKIWRTSIDDRVCPICIGLEGSKAKINDDFEAEGMSVIGPPAHVMCRCFLEYPTKL